MGFRPTKGDEGPLADARGSAWDAHCKQSRDRKGALEVWTFKGADARGIISDFSGFRRSEGVVAAIVPLKLPFVNCAWVQDHDLRCGDRRRRNR